MPIVIPDIPFIGGGKRKRAAGGPAPVGPLALVSAGYETGTHVDLAFDRAVDIGGINPSAIVVYDGDAEFAYAGSGATLIGPTEVRVTLSLYDNWSDPGVVLSTDGPTGIVAAGDGAAWAGVTDLPLPWP